MNIPISIHSQMPAVSGLGAKTNPKTKTFPLCLIGLAAPLIQPIDF